MTPTPSLPRTRLARLRLEALEDRCVPALTIREYDVPTAGGGPKGIVSYGSVSYFTESDANKIGVISADGTFRADYTIPTVQSLPYGITAGPPANSNPWFTELNGNKIGWMDPLGLITEFTVPTANSDPWGITAGPDGNIWFTERAGNKIGRAVIADGGQAVTFQEFALPWPDSAPLAITAGPDGNLWFTEAADRIGRITPAGVITEYPLPQLASTPTDIVVGPDSNLWFTEQNGNRIGRITPDGVITEFAIPTMGSRPFNIAAGQTDLWFTENAVGKIGRITPQGRIIEYPLPLSTAYPVGIAADASHIWFTVNPANRIGIFDIPPVIATGADAGGAPIVRVFDSASGGLLREFFAYDPAFLGGVRVAVADVNGDSAPDFITAPGPGGGPHIRVFDGITGQVVREFFAYDPVFRGGVYVAVGNLVDTHFPPNSRVEIITGAGEGGGPHVKAFHAGTGAELRCFMAYDPVFRGGVRVAAGLGANFPPDIVTGAGPGGGPHVKVFSGADLSVKQSFFAYDPGFAGSVFVAVDASTPNGTVITGAGAGGGPHAKAFDASSGAVLQSFFAYDVGFGGGIRVAAADLNADGAWDILTGTGLGVGPTVRGFDGRTLALVVEFAARDPAFTGGVFVGSR